MTDEEKRDRVNRIHDARRNWAMENVKDKNGTPLKDWKGGGGEFPDFRGWLENEGSGDKK